jgi:hypothetical protein
MKTVPKRVEFLEGNTEYQPVNEDLLPGSPAIEKKPYIDGLKLGLFLVDLFVIFQRIYLILNALVNGMKRR